MRAEPGPAETRRSLLIKSRLTPEEASAVEYAKAAKVGTGRREPNLLEGFVVLTQHRREYPNGASSCQILGRVTLGPRGQVRGIGGLEDWADTVLSGSVGWNNMEMKKAGVFTGRETGYRAEPVPGMDVRTTIDASIQQILSEELGRCMQEHTPLGATGIVLDPRNGDVLGMVSKPGVDLSDPDAPALIASNPELMRNRAMMLYEPGSVLKPLTVALALEVGVVKPTEDVPCQHGYTPDARPIRCEAHRSSIPASGQNVPRMIVAKSCNVAAAKLAVRLGATRLHEGLSRFGLFERTAIQLPGEAVGWSLTDPVRGRRSRDDVARVGFGQGITVTPLHLAAAFAVFANGGILHHPRIVRSYGYPGRPPAKEYYVGGGVSVLSPRVANEIRSYLGSVVEVGTGKPARLNSYTTGGKTGTAQKVKERRYAGYIASFIGMVPLRNPRAVIAIVVDEPHNGYHGSQAAAPTWARVAERLMDYWHVAPDKRKDAESPSQQYEGTSSEAMGD